VKRARERDRERVNSDAYDSGLESPRTGRLLQGIAVSMWVTSIGLAGFFIAAGDWWLLWSPAIVALSSWSTWRSAGRMIEGAREHHEHMEIHRARLAQLTKDLDDMREADSS
jgi:hypothetical protein